MSKKSDIVLEDVAYGIYDRPGPTGKIAEEEGETTVPSDVPLDPSPQMSNQLSVQRPPIEDEDYVPASIEELSRAASALAQLVPTKGIEHFYKNLHRLLDETTEAAAEKEMEEENSNVTEASIRAELRNLVLEMLSQEDLDDYDQFRQGYSVIDAPEEEKQSAPGEMSLDDMAKEFGYSGAPGMRQEIERLTNRLEYFATNVKETDLDALVDFAAGEFIDAMEAGGFVDEEDIDDLRSAPQMVKDLDSFKYFFVSAFVLPAYRKVVRDATKEIKTQIQDMGIPKELHQTVFNQVTGATASKPAVIKKKLDKLVSAGSIDSDEAKSMLEKILSAKGKMAASAEYSDEFVKTSLEKWSKTGKSAKVKALKQALEQTLSDQ